MTKIKQVCGFCKKEFKTTDIRIKEGRGKFCNQECYYKSKKGKSSSKRNGIVVPCQICGESFYVIKARSKTAKFCSRICQAKGQEGRIPWNKGQIKRECPVCGKQFEKCLSKIEHSRGKYCSQKCYRKKQRENYKKEIKEKDIINSYLNERKTCSQIAKEYGCYSSTIKNILRKNKIKTRRMNDYDRSAVYQKMRKNLDVSSIIKDYERGLSSGDLAKKYGCSPGPILERLKEHGKVRKGDEIHAAFSKSDKYSGWLKANKEKAKARGLKPEWREFQTKKILKMYQSGMFPRQMNTDIELIMKTELIKRGYKEGIDFIHQYKFHDKFMCDFIFLEKKIIVECDGDFWHANPSKYAGKPLKQAQKNTTTKDKSKNAYIKKVDNGSWTLLRFWESDIKKDVKSCVDKIEQALR